MTLSTPDWAEAACNEKDYEALFVRGAEQRKAKLVCLGCKVRTECLAKALDDRIEFGVWGGMTERERRALLRRRPDVRSWADLLAAGPAFEAFYRNEFNRLVGFAVKLGYKPQDALDGAQAAFVEAWRQWASIRQPRAWVRKVVVRSLQSAPETLCADVPEPAHPQTVDDFDISDQSRAVFDAFRRLPVQQRIVMAYTFDGFTSVEIAGELDLTPENARKTLQRARAALKRLLGHGEGSR